MSKSKPKKQSQAGDTEIENYEEIFDAVEAGNLSGVVISPWHKGIDITIRGDKGFRSYFVDWYIEMHSRGVFDPEHNKISIDLSTKGKKLFFDITEIWDRSADQFYPDNSWSEYGFQEFVFNLLTEKVKKRITPRDLDISISVECVNQSLGSYCMYSISDRTGDVDDISVTPKKEKLIAKYVLDWHTGSSSDDASIEITDSSDANVEFKEDEKELSAYKWLVTPSA